MNKKYQLLFEQFNQRYFGDTLPKYQIKLGGLHGCNKGEINRKKKLIFLRESEETEQVLIHEMAHAATNDFHGPSFIDELKRLDAEGAPVNHELRPSWCPWRCGLSFLKHGGGR